MPSHWTESRHRQIDWLAAAIHRWWSRRRRKRKTAVKDLIRPRKELTEKSESQESIEEYEVPSWLNDFLESMGDVD